MKIFDQFFTKFSYKFPKGYPDMDNPNDVALLESLISETIGKKFTLNEANLQGAATGYPGSLGSFTKYVVDNPKHDPTSSDSMNYTADRDAVLLDTNEKTPSDPIKKGEEFKITIKSIDKVQRINNSNYIPILFNNKNYLIRTTDVRKPTGKAVEPIQIDIDNKKDGVYPGSFVPGHPQEGKVISLFIEGTDDNWGFEYNGLNYNVEYLGDPEWKGKGKPKTDVQIILNKTARKDIGKDMKISLKAGNAMFVENWVIPTRAVQILGKDNLKKEIIDIYNELIKGTLFRKGTKAKNLALFVGTNPNSYSIGGRGAYKLTGEEAYEAYVATEKFGKDSPATANCFFKGIVPPTPGEFIEGLVPFTPSTVDKELEDLYLYVRGSNESRGGSLFLNRKDIDSPWTISSRWMDELGINQSEDKDGNIKYS